MICKCPNCGGELTRKKYTDKNTNKEREFIGCSNWKDQECKFFLFPNFLGTELTDEQLKDLIENGQTSKRVTIKPKLKFEDNRIKIDYINS